MRSALAVLGAILAILALAFVILFFPSEWKPAFVALLFLVIFSGFYFGFAAFIAQSQSNLAVPQPQLAKHRGYTQYKKAPTFAVG